MLLFTNASTLAVQSAHVGAWKPGHELEGNIPLYLHPPAQAAVPMTEAQIFACDPVPHVMFDQQRIDFARAIEAFHGITAQGAKLVTKPDSRPQNCGTGHCSCIECPYPKTDGIGVKP
jgi:hypothetical protein